jgi:hypothetical protein
MSRDMSQTDNAFGFQPYEKLLRTGMYVVETNPTIAFYHGDMVHYTAGGGQSILSSVLGYMPKIADDNVITANDILIGSVVGIFDEYLQPLKYMAVARTGDSTIAGHLLVADHPLQLFVAQEDADGNAITAVEGQINAAIFPPTLNAGNTHTGISKMEIDSDSANNDATLHLRLLRPHPNDVAHVDGKHCRFICMINDHVYGNVGQI